MIGRHWMLVGSANIRESYCWQLLLVSCHRVCVCTPWIPARVQLNLAHCLSLPLSLCLHD